MKKIINGKLYNTETAKRLFGCESDEGINDFNFWHEVLYQKRNGEFFLWGEGGAASRWSSRDGSGYTWGENIVALSDSEAREWAERRLSADDYLEIFSAEE